MAGAVAGDDAAGARVVAAHRGTPQQIRRRRRTAGLTHPKARAGRAVVRSHRGGASQRRRSRAAGRQQGPGVACKHSKAFGSTSVLKRRGGSRASLEVIAADWVAGGFRIVESSESLRNIVVELFRELNFERSLRLTSVLFRTLIAKYRISKDERGFGEENLYVNPGAVDNSEIDLSGNGETRPDLIASRRRGRISREQDAASNLRKLSKRLGSRNQSVRVDGFPISRIYRYDNGLPIFENQSREDPHDPRKGNDRKLPSAMNHVIESLYSLDHKKRVSRRGKPGNPVSILLPIISLPPLPEST